MSYNTGINVVCTLKWFIEKNNQSRRLDMGWELGYSVIDNCGQIIYFILSIVQFLIANTGIVTQTL